jgi:hypothetical protein
MTRFFGLPIAALILTTLAVTSIWAQKYSEWSAPENLGPVVNTTGFDGCPFLTKDGLDLLFMSNVGSSAQNLYVTHRESIDSPWGIPESLGADINTAAYAEGCPMLTISGRYLYFFSNRPGGCGDADIWVARRTTKKSFTEWETPQNLGCVVNSAGPEFSPSLFEDDDGTVYLYFSSGLRMGGLGFGDVWVSKQVDGVFSVPEPVTELNSTSNDIRPKIRARDGLEIFYDSNRPGAVSADIYTSTRECILCSWEAPVRLTSVSSSGLDGGPALSFDGTELYFMSDRTDITGTGGQDLYVARRERLKGSE